MVPSGRSWIHALVCLALAASCGGSVEKDREQSMSAGAGGSPPSSSSGVNASSGNAGSPSLASAGESGLEAGGASAGEGGESAASGEAGMAENTAVNARVESGRRFCLDDRDCEGLTCTASLGRVQDACLAPCSTDVDCKREEECFSQVSIPTSCFQRCTDPTECEYQYDCADYYGTGDYLCLPSDWVRFWAVPRK